jgi:uncharacterized membrane protein
MRAVAQTTDTVRCPVCREERAAGDLISGETLPEAIAGVIQNRQPTWSRNDTLCAWCVSDAEATHIQDMLETTMGALSPMENSVVESIRNREIVSANPNAESDRVRTRSEHVADRIAATVGSWWFSGTILILLALWIVVNVLFQPFDPYPIVVMAAISAGLASLAALQGPIILMSQRRQLKYDRLRAGNDYQVNLKAEVEVRSLDEKIDRVLALQKRILETQLQSQNPKVQTPNSKSQTPNSNYR